VVNPALWPGIRVPVISRKVAVGHGAAAATMSVRLWLMMLHSSFYKGCAVLPAWDKHVVARLAAARRDLVPMTQRFAKVGQYPRSSEFGTTNI
jgi:hypothetical protein